MMTMSKTDDPSGRSGITPDGADSLHGSERLLDEFEEQLFEELRLAQEEYDRTMIEIEASRCWLDRIFDRIGFGVVWPGSSEAARMPRL